MGSIYEFDVLVEQQVFRRRATFGAFVRRNVNVRAGNLLCFGEFAAVNEFLVLPFLCSDESATQEEDYGGGLELLFQFIVAVFF